MPFVKCLNCGKEFYVKPSYVEKRKFCSWNCYLEWKKSQAEKSPEEKENSKLIKRICQRCGKVFYVKPSEVKRGRGKYCSWECYKNRVRKICLNCGKEFEVVKAREHEAKFCSRKCLAEWRSKHIVGKNHPRFVEKIKKICIVCGKEFEVYPNRKDTALFCSKECRDKYYDMHRITISCLNCGKPVSIKISEYSHRRFCSKKCMYEFRRTIKQEETIKKIVDLYQQGLSTRAIASIMGVGAEAIRKTLHRAGIKLRKYNWQPKKIKTLDGHIVKSAYEKIVDDWLFINGIPHEYEPKVDRLRYRPDFKVGEYYIEVWGMIDNEKYVKKMIYKQELYKTHGLKIINIYPWDLRNLNKKLRILKQFAKHT